MFRFKADLKYYRRLALMRAACDVSIRVVSELLCNGHSEFLQFYRSGSGIGSRSFQFDEPDRFCLRKGYGLRQRIVHDVTELSAAD